MKIVTMQFNTEQIINIQKRHKKIQNKNKSMMNTNMDVIK